MKNFKWTLQNIAKWTKAQIISSHQLEFNEVGTDTRSDLKDKIFIALKGDNYDAHQFLDEAVKNGAKALIVHELVEKFSYLKDQVSILIVDDTLKALQSFAKEYRKSLPTKIIGITGSNGKTTSKEFTAQVLSEFKKTHYSQGSFNNHWGVPLTLLATPIDAHFAVIEMGMNHAGEITDLVNIADPDIVVCTMVGVAHIEYFGSAKKIAEAKQEIYLASKENCIRIFNQDSDLTYDMMYPVARRFPDSRMLSFSMKNNEADVYMQVDELTMRDLTVSGFIAGVAAKVTVPIFGQQNLVNLMAAANIAYACGMAPEKIWKALAKCKTAWGRNQFIQTEIGAEILFDGYNANPDSMKALMQNMPLIKTEGNKIAVIGQMKELGNQSSEAHIELGKIVGDSNFSYIFFVGENKEDFAKGILESKFNGKSFFDSEFNHDLGLQLSSILQKNDIVVIKGSRGAHTEKFISYCKPIDWVDKK